MTDMIYELNALDRNFADFIVRESGQTDALFRHIVGLLSNAVAHGHICLNLADIAGREIIIDGNKVSVPELKELHRHLSKMPTVSSGGEFRPLVMDGKERLYLYRYWKYEHDLARIILDKASSTDETLDKKNLSEELNRLFPEGDDKAPDWQKVAAVAALRKKFVIVSGGPGTGKTSTVIKILALLLEQHDNAGLKIALAAPTGKAAMRLKESITAMKDHLDCNDSIKKQIPGEVSTIHRLLGTISGSTRFRYSGKNLMPYDIVIIDEASMVALPLMAKLALALKQDSRLILIGDRDQLASVEAGAVLGDMCGGGREEFFSPDFGKLFTDLTGSKIPASAPDKQKYPLTDCLVVLKKNYRFHAESGIAAAGRFVNDGNGADALSTLKDGKFPDIAWQETPRPNALKNALTKPVIEGYGAYLSAENAADALKLYDAFRILCALNQGPYGVEGINVLVEQILSERGLINPQQRWYKGRPVLITVNDYNMKLFNG
ncbi:MAG: exodeoxyribonuclease V subunit alpha, partial [Smithella sp.]|nr:exodeoxyribonuclease V subunit alpha [Smithella sp.]